MNANVKKNVIEMTATEAAAAGKLNSEKFIELKELQSAFPGFRITIVKNTAKKVNHFKGLDMEYMEKYIKAHNESLLGTFYQLCGKDENGKKKEMAATASYGEIKMWFLTQFPEIEKMGENINKIIEETRKTREARKAG